MCSVRSVDFGVSVGSLTRFVPKFGLIIAFNGQTWTLLIDISYLRSTL